MLPLGAAGADDNVTIGDVAAMGDQEKLGYILTNTAERVVEIGDAEGEQVRGCLKRELLGIKLNEDETVFVPRGLKAVFQLIDRHNKQGGAHFSAAAQIREIVDLVAQHACGVTAISTQR